MKVYITGLGSISAIGSNTIETLQSVMNNSRGMSWSEEHQLMLAGIPYSNDQLKEITGLQLPGISRTTLIGVHAAKEAWGENVPMKEIRTGLVSSTSVGELDITENIIHTYTNLGKEPEMKLFTQEAGSTTEQIADYLSINGYVNTLSTACSSSANAIMLGSKLIKAGKLDRVIVGGSDPFDLHNIFGFRSLNICDSSECKPFDKDREGLNLGEGAAYLLLENEASIQKTGNKKLGRVSGYANTSDAFHQTALSPEGIGATYSMKEALRSAGLAPRDIDYINAHGTGTINNDLSESRAIQNVFKNNIPSFTSTKCFTGHTLAAAGSLEMVISILCMNNDLIPANLGFKSAIPETGISPNSTLKKQEIKHLLSNSFGFGGNCTSLIVSKI